MHSVNASSLLYPYSSMHWGTFTMNIQTCILSLHPKSWLDEVIFSNPLASRNRNTVWVGRAFMFSELHMWELESFYWIGDKKALL